MMHRSIWRGVGLATVQCRGRKWNWERKPRRYSIDEMEVIYQEYMQGGITQKGLANKYGCCESTIRKVLDIVKSQVESRARKLEATV